MNEANGKVLRVANIVADKVPLEVAHSVDNNFVVPSFRGRSKTYAKRGNIQISSARWLVVAISGRQKPFSKTSDFISRGKSICKHVARQHTLEKKQSLFV